MTLIITYFRLCVCRLCDSDSTLCYLLADIGLFALVTLFLFLLGFALSKSKYVKSLSSLKEVDQTKAHTTKNIYTYLTCLFFGILSIVIYNGFAWGPDFVYYAKYILFLGVLAFVILKAKSSKKYMYNWPTKKIIVFFKKNHTWSFDKFFIYLISFYTMSQRSFSLVYQLTALRLLILGHIDLLLWYYLVLVLIVLVLITKPVQYYYRNKYGKDIFRLLGYNASIAKIFISTASNNSKLFVGVVVTGTGVLVVDEATADTRNHKRYIRLSKMAAIANQHQAVLCSDDPNLIRRKVIIPDYQEEMSKRWRKTAILAVKDVAATAKAGEKAATSVKIITKK